MENQKYIVVENVVEDSEAERVGLQKGDIIVEYDASEIKGDNKSYFYFFLLFQKRRARIKLL